MIRNKVEPLQWYQVAYLVTSSLDFLVTIPLIYGIKKVFFSSPTNILKTLINSNLQHSRYYLLPWITYNLIFLVLITVGCIVITFLTYFSAIFLLVCSKYFLLFLNLTLSPYFSVLVVFWYFWMCIVSLFREMGMNDGRGRIINITTQPTEKTFYL